MPRMGHPHQVRMGPSPLAERGPEDTDVAEGSLASSQLA
jgi:hypothetical protein